jgi:hypothetical protein
MPLNFAKFTSVEAVAVTPADVPARDLPATWDITPENLRLMGLKQKEEDGLLNASQAAVLLGVSRERVHALMATGRLRRFSFCGQHYVSHRELSARRAADVKSGRPRRNLSERVKVGVKAALLHDRAQMANGGFRGPCEK